MRVMIADDEATSRYLLEDILQEWGYETESAADGLEALDVLERDDAPRLAIIDWMMPGMDGLELCRKLRASATSQYSYIVLLTSKSEKKDVVLGMDSGADAFLTKPVDLDQLRSLLSAGKRILDHQAKMASQRATKRQAIPTVASTMPRIAAVDRVEGQRLLVDATDLTREQLLLKVPRVLFEERVTPMLGGAALLNRLGEGGMGSVYRGYNPKLRREVAVKVPFPEIFRAQRAAEARFFREAQIAALVQSEHLIRVQEVGHDFGLSYMMMELVNGKTASQVMKAHAQLTGIVGLGEHIALEICIAAAKGLAAAHASGIVHRDIKPDNILIPYNETLTALDYSAAKLADLGIARRESETAGLTATNVSLGTIGYMAPEQICNARNAGKPADIFGLGVTLYWLVTGKAPFKCDSVYETLADTIHNPHQTVRFWRPDVSQNYAAIVDACLAKNPLDRYQDAGLLVDDLIYCRRLLESSEQPGASEKAKSILTPSRAAMANIAATTVLLSAVPVSAS